MVGYSSSLSHHWKPKRSNRPLTENNRQSPIQIARNIQIQSPPWQSNPKPRAKKENERQTTLKFHCQTVPSSLFPERSMPFPSCESPLNKSSVALLFIIDALFPFPLAAAAAMCVRAFFLLCRLVRMWRAKRKRFVGPWHHLLVSARPLQTCKLLFLFFVQFRWLAQFVSERLFNKQPFGTHFQSSSYFFLLLFLPLRDTTAVTYGRVKQQPHQQQNKQRCWINQN